MDSRFGSLPGVVRTRAGYAGGTTAGATYENLGDHTEVVEVVYDPQQISYDQLLEVFWKSHDPTRAAWSRQYRPVLFYFDKTQRLAALQARQRLKQRLGTEVHTEILAAGTFYQAEDYHQKYYLRQHPRLLEEVRKDLVRSTAAARLNGYLGGFAGSLEAELDRLGLSGPGRAELLRQVKKGGARCQ